MPTPEIFYTLAEVSIAFVGFAAVLGVLSVRAEVWPGEVKVMFRALIEIGLLALFMCVFPMAFELFGFNDEARWLWVSALSIAVGIGLTMWRFHMVRTRLGRLPREAPWLFLFTLVTFVMLIGNVAVWRSPGPYLVAICTSLAAAAAIFLAMIYRLFPIPRVED